MISNSAPSKNSNFLKSILGGKASSKTTMMDQNMEPSPVIKRKKRKLSPKMILAIVFSLLFAIGLGAALLLVNINQDLRQQAKIDGYDRCEVDPNHESCRPAPKPVTQGEIDACSAGGGVIVGRLCVAQAEIDSVDNCGSNYGKPCPGETICSSGSILSGGRCVPEDGTAYQTDGVGGTYYEAYCEANPGANVCQNPPQQEIDACGAGGGVIVGRLCVAQAEVNSVNNCGSNYGLPCPGETICSSGSILSGGRCIPASGDAYESSGPTQTYYEAYCEANPGANVCQNPSQQEIDACSATGGVIAGRLCVDANEINSVENCGSNYGLPCPGETICSSNSILSGGRCIPRDGSAYERENDEVTTIGSAEDRLVTKYEDCLNDGFLSPGACAIAVNSTGDKSNIGQECRTGNDCDSNQCRAGVCQLNIATLYELCENFPSDPQCGGVEIPTNINEEKLLDQCRYGIKPGFTGCYASPQEAAAASLLAADPSKEDGVRGFIGGGNSGSTGQICLDADGCQCADGGFTVANGSCQSGNPASGRQLYASGQACNYDYECGTANCSSGVCQVTSTGVDLGTTTCSSAFSNATCAYGSTGCACNNPPLSEDQFIAVGGAAVGCDESSGRNCSEGYACADNGVCQGGGAEIGAPGFSSSWDCSPELGLCCREGCCQIADGYFGVTFSQDNVDYAGGVVSSNYEISTGDACITNSRQVLGNCGEIQMDVFKGSPDNFSLGGPTGQGAWFGPGYTRSGLFTSFVGEGTCTGGPAPSTPTAQVTVTSNPPGGGGDNPPVNPPPNIYTCNSPCTSDAQCQTADSRFICSSEEGNRCRLNTNPTSAQCQPAVGPQCLSIDMTNVSNPNASATDDPELGDAVSFTCGEVAGADHYIFQVIEPDGTITDLQATGRTSETFTISQNGGHAAQCQICTGPDAASCLPYEDPYNQQ